MSLQASGLRFTGQDSDIVDIFLPSSPCRLDVGLLSPVPSKQLSSDSESIKSWIDEIYHANTSVIKLDDSDDDHLPGFATYPFGTCRPRSPFSDESRSESDVSFYLDVAAWAPEMFPSPYDDDSNERHSKWSFSDDAQYITISSDSPWYRPPPSSPGPVTAYELTTSVYANSCSNEVRQAIAQQELLLAIFYRELRRAVPHDDVAGYDPDWLEGVDADLVLAPLETYADLCWESAVCENSPSLKLERPIPDVPEGFDEFHGAS